MALTKSFRETVMERAKEDPSFRREMLIEAVNLFLAGEVDIGKMYLRDYINATIGFGD